MLHHVADLTIELKVNVYVGKHCMLALNIITQQGFMQSCANSWNVCMVSLLHCEVTGSSNTVSVPSVTVVESLVQVTMVAGLPVKIQVRVN